ncbi:sigma-54-dependent transcriptional regulator [Tuwongella immobilis]|uniref:Sigma-54-dependent Fis family transcriptional regulator n=1 Tax=Tuwongella immobilis TaxID=692036 RepID=A0A6C2YMN1_9BACT|nr:sigma-54 dependent transcriptional regulator [Tuwongella immobilis]VIP02469.1 fis family transcriptional regulator : Response regulator with CheY-like receiver, AAA-type ATPase, and DNA-binding domains OS=Singulisphaera acidiphila (strain ATCC BAA-1392 / DSM 18658 / VKM B-2454 / MOB10) GN=Sinac_1866 PE=4 SV=1: Response_reg: Sigma54_activat: HTH_8 [Tuwongella immobilis]VTS01493.1 fis family transcriptional regulator : Response regulator with CheY-like receiver, AAA-type ATPase, and DNA-binding 
MANRIARPRAVVLIVDDELIIRETIGEFLQQQGYDVVLAPSGEDAIKRITDRRFDIILCDINLPGVDGLEVLDRVRQVSPETSVMLITAYATVENAVEAFQKGAHDFLMKPILLEEVGNKIRRLLTLRDLSMENQWLRRELNREAEADRLIGKSAAMQRVHELIRRVAPTPSTVLIQGESGTGKELVARAIHRQSTEARPRDGRFIALNCAAIPADLLENQLFGHRRGAFTGADRDSSGVFIHAGDGTVFLDEIGELPLGTQAKLLRTLEQKEIFPVGANEPVEIEARIVAATNKDLTREVEAGRFREDLFYRLNVLTIPLPPLRERRDDIPELVEFLLARHARLLGKRFTGVSHEAMQTLMTARWKGNVRELDNAIQRAVILGEAPLITPFDLPPDLAPPPNDPFAVDDLSKAVERFEKMHIERILKQTPDKREAARRLDIGLSSLYRKIELLGIEVPNS